MAHTLPERATHVGIHRSRTDSEPKHRFPARQKESVGGTEHRHYPVTVTTHQLLGCCPIGMGEYLHPDDRAECIQQVRCSFENPHLVTLDVNLQQVEMRGT